MTPSRRDLKGGKCLDNTRPAVLLLYDAGYLTIKNIINGQYLLGFPNEEMELAFYKDCADSVWHANHSADPEIRLIADSLKKKKSEFHTFMSAVNSPFVTRSDKTHHRTLWQKHPWHSRWW